MWTDYTSKYQSIIGTKQKEIILYGKILKNYTRIQYSDYFLKIINNNNDEFYN